MTVLNLIRHFSRIMSADKRRLIYSIVQFLNKELSSDDISEDAKESLEVASQCLQTAYCLAPEDTHLTCQLDSETKLCTLIADNDFEG